MSLKCVAALLLTFTAAGLHAQAPAVPDPIAQVAAGTGTASTPTCTTGTPNTAGTNLGDGCAPATAGVAAPQGVSVDRLGNLYIADYTDRQLRVVYAAGTQLAAAITAANSGYTISATRSAPATVPVPGNIYTLAGLGSTPAALTATNAAGAYECANYASASQPTALNALGDGCPAASAPIGPRAVQSDSDGNLFLVDYTNSRVRVLCVNCAASTTAAQLITLANPGVIPANGAMYTVAGFAGGYRDAAPGFASATAATANVALLRSPTALSLSPNDDLYIADQGNNAIRLLYNGGPQALALLTAEGIATPQQGYVYTIVGAGCVSAATGKTGSVTAANSCLTTTLSADGTLGTVSGVNTPWSLFLDPNQNLYFGDSGNSRYRVLAGGIAQPVATAGALTPGAVYTIAGAGTSTLNGIPAAQLALTATAAQGIGGDLSGNLFLADYIRNVIYELYASNGTITALVGANTPTTLAAGTVCPATTSSNVFGDACPANYSKLLTPRGNIAVDSANNLYFGDSADNIVQKYAYPTFPLTPTGTSSAAQVVAFTFNGSLNTNGFTAPAEFTLVGSTCLGNQAFSTCGEALTFTPAHPGIRSSSVVLVLPDNTPVAVQPLIATGLGAALNTDLANPIPLGTGLQPTATAIDRLGNLYVADLASKSVLRYSSTTNSTSTTIATNFTAPSGIAVDPSLNVYIADSTANIIRKAPSVSVSPTQGTTPFTLLSGLKTPRGLAVDLNGNLLIANTGANQVLLLTPNGTLPSVVTFSGLNAPQAVAVDTANNYYVADTGNARILRLTPTGIQTVVANIASTGLTIDPAGDLLAFSGTSLLELPSNLGQAITLATGLSNPRAVALDFSGNVAIADQSKTGLLTLNRTVPTYTFTASPASNPFTVTSTGNATFTPAVPFITNSDTTHFTAVPSTSNGCSGNLAPGATCNLTTTFAATTAGTYADIVAFNGNATNSPGLALTGTNTAEATTTTFTASSLAVTYGTTITFTATVKGTATTPSSGTVAFKNATTTLATATVGTGGTATASIVLPAGAQSITATYTPSNVNYAPSTSVPTAITVTPAVLTVSATSTSRQFGVANPAFTYTLSGFVNGDTQASATTGTPTESTTATLTSPQGTYPITIAQGTLAAANYTFTSSPGTLTVTPAVPVLTLTVNPTSAFGGAPVTLTATVTSTVGNPTGSVSFYTGTTLLSTVALTSGTATLTTTALPTGTDSVTAVYSGDTAFATVTSSATFVTVGVPFGITASTTALSFPRNYQEAQSILTINPGGRTDNLTFACSGLPAKVSCAFTPTTLALTGLAGPQQVTLLVSNSAATTAGVRANPNLTWAFGGLALFLVVATRRRKLLPRLLAFALFATLAGCGSGPTATEQASGTYNFNVIVTGATTTTIPYTLNIQ